MPVKSCRLLIVCIFTGICSFCRGQAITIEKGIFLPMDTLTQTQFLTGLNGFVYQKERPNKDNTYVLHEALPETSALLDEMKGIEKNVRLKNDSFFKGYLTNVIKLDENNYLVQLSYIGVLENLPFLRASFRIRAKKINNRFYFYSPLKENTQNWHAAKLGNITCYYKSHFSQPEITYYQKITNLYDKKLNVPAQPTSLYYCDNFTEVQQLLGIDYKEDYNSLKYNSITSHEKNTFLVLSGGSSAGTRFDPHDTWHDQLGAVVDPNIINRPVDEGCAYLFGGSWGLPWVTVLAKFKAYAALHTDADWLNLYTTTSNYQDGEKSLKVPYVLNALIIQKIEKEKGFAPVMELLKCGKRKQGDDNYFKALEKVAGITKANFNQQMWALIKAQ